MENTKQNRQNNYVTKKKSEKEIFDFYYKRDLNKNYLFYYLSGLAILFFISFFYFNYLDKTNNTNTITGLSTVEGDILNNNELKAKNVPIDNKKSTQMVVINESGLIVKYN